jgi:hypothetical protein
MEEYYETMPEETQQEEGDYPTLEEIQSAPPPVEQPAPVLQAVTTLATGVESKGPVDYVKHLDEVYRQIAPKIQEQEKQFAMEGAKLGDVNYVGSIVQDMYKRNNEMNAEKANHIQRFRDVASVAFDNVVFNNTGIIYNNTPEQIAKSAERTINTVTVASTMERLQKESTLAGMAGSFALAFTPLGITTNVALGSAAEKYIGEASSKVNYGKTIDELRYFYTTLGSESEKVSFIQTFQKELENTWSLTKYDSVNILNEIVTEPEGISTVGNVFYSSAPLLGAIPIVGQVSKSAKLLSAASKLSKTAKAENIVAGVGGKDSIVEAAASAMRQKAVLGLASEVTGVQSAIDITNLATKGTSAVLGKMLPDAITTASGKVQEAILESVEKANQKLRSTIGLQNVRESEIEDLIKSQMVKYDKNIDKTLHMVHIGRTENDPLGVLTTVLRGTQDGTVFLTKKAVDEYIKVADPSGKLGLKAVKDTANNTHALTEESKRALILERDAAMAKILSLEKIQTKSSSAVNVFKTVEEATDAVKTLPPVKDGFARFYSVADTTRVTQDIKRAYSYGKGKNITYIDIPVSDKRLVKAFDDTGTSNKSPYVNFNISEKEAKTFEPIVLKIARVEAAPAKAVEPTVKAAVETTKPAIEIAEGSKVDPIYHTHKGVFYVGKRGIVVDLEVKNKTTIASLDSKEKFDDAVKVWEKWLPTDENGKPLTKQAIKVVNDILAEAKANFDSNGKFIGKYKYATDIVVGNSLHKGERFFKTAEEAKNFANTYGQQKTVSKATGTTFESTKAEQQVVADAIRGKSVPELAKWALENSKSELDKFVMAKVFSRIEAMEKDGVKFTFELLESDSRKLSMSNARGMVSSNVVPLGQQKEITLSLNGPVKLENQLNFPSGMDFEIIKHELIHAATQAHYGTSDKTIKELKDLFNTVIKEFNVRAKEGKLEGISLETYKRLNNFLENPQELLAWGLTNAKAQEFLLSIKVGEKTLWSKLVTVVRNALGISKDYESAFDRLLRVSEDILEVPPEQVRKFVEAEGLSLGRADASLVEKAGGFGTNQPAWATRVAKSIDSEVIFTTDTVGLVKGQSVSGKDIYLGIFKNGQYTRVDIEKYTGSGFSAEELSTLQKAKENYISKNVVTRMQEGASEEETLNKLQATVDLANARLKAASDIENGLSAGWLVEEKIKANLNASSLGKFKEEDIQSMMRFAFGDKALGASKEVYEAHLLGVMAESRIRGVLVDMVEKPIRALNRKDRIALNNALVAGDKEGKVFDAVELRGMDLVSDESQKAYYAVRAARDMTWRLRNQAASKSMTLKGWKEMWHPAIAKYKDELQGFKLFGKEADTSAIGKRALDPNTGETMVISANRLEELNNRGFKIVEFDTPVPMAGVNRTHVIVQAGGLELKTITEVIPYRTGEMSRIYDDEYFVRLKGSKELDGLKEDVNITHRTAKSAREANAYAKAYNEMVALYKEGKLDTQAAAKMQAYGWKPEDLIASIAQNPRVEAVVNYTRTDDDYLETLTSYGRSFTSKRGEHIPDVFGNTTNVVDPLDALASEIGNTAYMASHTEWFDVSIQRWFETAKPFLSPEMQKMTADKAFARYVTTKGSYVGQDKTELFVRRVADQIAEAMKVNDKESRQMLGLMKSLTESFEAKTGKFENVGSFMRQTNWESFAKTVAFHCVFAFNPVQFFVQGANTVNAIAISPLHGLKAAKTYMFLRTALASDNPDVWAMTAKTNKWSSIGMESEEDFIRLVKAVDRSGLIENLQTSSLYNMQLGKHNLTKGFLSGDLIRASTVPFREGEGASRLIAFDISRREWMKANPGKVWDTDEALKEILVRQDMLTGTMTNANTAWWQKGLISIPAQFLQFPVKFGLNIVNSLSGGSRTFTRKEALSLIIGNLTLFGTAGLLGTSLAQSVFGDSIGELSEDQRLALSQGVIASAVSAVTSAFDEEGEGAQLAIGDRINPLKFYVDFVKGLGNLEEAKALEMIGGPFFGMMQRLGLAGSQIKDLYVVNPDLSPEKASEAIKALVKITSVGNNYFQGVRAENLYNQHVSKGVGQYRFNDKELFYQKYFGIKPAAAVDFQSITESNIDYAKRMKKEAERITDLRIKALEAYRAGDTTTGEKYGNMVNILLSSMPINDRAEVESKTRTIDASTKLDEMLVEHMLERSGTSKKSTMVINQP